MSQLQIVGASMIERIRAIRDIAPVFANTAASTVLASTVLASMITLGTALALSPSAHGETSKAEPDSQQSGSLRICAAASELPYSSRTGDGFENKIATVLAQAMGRTVEFVWSDRAAIYLVGDLLEQKRCDIVMGIDSGDPRVLTSKPYYRTGYVFIERKDSSLHITDWNSADLQKANKVGFTPGSPAQVMMEKIGIFRDNFNYMHSLTNFQDRRNRFTRVPPDRMVNEVADGTADLAVNFAPEVARYARDKDNLKLVVIPDDNVRDDGVKVPHQFDQSIGVRKDDAQLLTDINNAIDKSKRKIEAILKQEGIPLLSLSGLPGTPGKESSIKQHELGPEFE